MTDHGKSDSKPSIQSPEEPTSVQIKPISKSAGGMTAAITAAKYAFRGMGIAGKQALILPASKPVVISIRPSVAGRDQLERNQ